MEKVRIYASRRTLLLMLLGSTAFVAASLWIIGSSIGGPVGSIIAVLGIGFFGLAGIYFLVELVYRRPILQIDADGIIDRASLASAGRLEWLEINSVRIYSVEGQRMLEILPRDPQAAAGEPAGASAGVSGTNTERYTRAIGQLDVDIHVRLGGIYALQRIATDSPHDLPTIVQVLCAYVRHRGEKPVDDSPQALDAHRQPEDVQAALTVINHLHRYLSYDDQAIDLSGAHLERAILFEAHLERANMRQAHLKGADLRASTSSGLDRPALNFSGRGCTVPTLTRLT